MNCAFQKPTPAAPVLNSYFPLAFRSALNGRLRKADSPYALAHSAVRMRERLKVILMSGQESDGHGFPVIRKPFLPDDLRRTMARHTGLC